MASVGRIAAIIGGLFMIVACIFYSISNALPLWGSVTNELGKLTVGLWRICESDNGIMLCENFPLICSPEIPGSLPMCNKITVARVFVTIACILSALSALCLFACIITRTDANRIVTITSNILPIVSFAAGLIGLSVGITLIMTLSSAFKMDVATILGITAVGVNAIGAFVALMVR